MAEVIKMPKMSDTMTEGVIASWLVKVGDKVKPGDILAEVETDKATMELENYEEGVILYIGVDEKASVPVDGIIAVVGEEGEDYKALLNGKSSGQTKTDKPKAESGDNNSAPEDAPEDVSDEEAPDDAEAGDTSSIPAVVVNMPKMSDTMTEGVIASWLVKVGDKVKPGDILAEVETDKATMELENYEEGTVLYLAVEAGGSVPVDGVIAIVGEAGTDYKPLLNTKKPKAEKKEEKKDAAPAKASPAAPAKAKPEQEAVPQAKQAGGRVLASPLAKKMAADSGYDIAQIPGSGENGRIIRRDVEAFKPQAAPEGKAQDKQTFAAAPAGKESFREEPVSQMRKTIARRLAESKFTAPHFYLTMEIDMDKAIAARVSLNEVAPVKISYNDMVIKAAAVALRQHPKVNVAWLGDKMRYNEHVHIGVAVAVDEGLLVPVVRFADTKGLSQISAEVKELGQKAKTKKLQPSEWEGNTFTISNLGMFGIEEFTAIINPPDACIMAVGGIKQVPVVKDGQIVPGNTMKVTLSCDHRAVDGAVGSAFLQTFKQLLEDPVRILL